MEDMDEQLKKAEEKMNKTLNALESEYTTIRAGRANPEVLNKITVDYYGVPTPINQMAAVSVTDGRTLQIQPWDISSLREIEKAINTSELGINPTNDGKVIRLSFPPLTEERRRDLVKEVSKFAEEAKVAVRSVRRDTIEKYKAMKKNGEITEDDMKAAEKDVQNLTDRYCKEVDSLAARKEQAILEIQSAG